MSQVRTWAVARRVYKAASAALLAGALLSGCGGGGGDGGPSPAPPPAPGGFSLSTTTLSFAAKFLSAPAAPQSILVTLEDSTTAAVGAAYKPGVTPAGWLTVTVSGSAPQFSMAFFANTTTLPADTYATTVTIGTADANGNILQTRDVQVTYTVREGLSVTSPSAHFTAVAGSSQSNLTLQVTAHAPGTLQWVASSSESWLLPPAGTQTGSGIHTVGIDTSMLPPGLAAATLTLANIADPTDTAIVNVTVNVTAPALMINTQDIKLGGESGLDRTPVPLEFSLGTGTRAHPWTIVASTTSGGDWLKLSATSGTVSAAKSTVSVSAERGQLAAGHYSGELVLQATVNGSAITRTLPISFRLEANRLVVSATGVAFSKFPSRAVLTRTIAVRNTAGEPDIGWQATSSQPWLAATLSGTTGEPLVLTADPTALPAGQYFAEASVVSTSPGVDNTETVRVGLTVSAADPPAQIDAPGALALATVANPVEPEVFVATSTSVRAYDVHSGALLRTLPETGGTPLALAMSGDGLSLYVGEDRAQGDRIVELDPGNGALRRTFILEQSFGHGLMVTYARPDSHPVLLTANETFDALTAVRFGLLFADGALIVASPDQSYVYTQSMGLSPARIHRYELHYGTFAPVPLLATRLATNDGANRANGADLALSPDGAVVYVAAGYPYQFDRLAAHMLVPLLPTLPGTPYPVNVETCWNGLVGAGADASNEPAGDLWIYDAAGVELARLDSGANALFRQSLRFSGDCTRLVSGSGSGVRIHAVP